MDIPISGVDTWLTLNNIPLSFQNDNENLDAQAQESRDNLFRITNAAPDDLQIYVDEKLLQTERYGRWLWKPDGYAGLYLLQVSAPGYPLQSARIRVLPEKLSYERYKTMLDDVSKITVDLLFRLNSPAGEKAVTQYREEESSALRNYGLIHKIMNELDEVMDSIRRSPHRVLQEYSEQKLLHEVRQFSSETSPVGGAVLALPAQATTSRRLDLLPATWLIQQNTPTYDVHENRLLKHLSYSHFYRLYLQFQQKLKISLDTEQYLTTLTLRKMWDLYQIWSVFHITRTIVDILTNIYNGPRNLDTERG